MRAALAFVLFLGTCAALFPLATRIADPMTHAPMASQPHRLFPVLVMAGDVPWIVKTTDPGALPPLPRHVSYLVPREGEAAIERSLSERHLPASGGHWRLRVEQLGAGRQEIELYWISDGYAGGAYEATATTIVPKYRKVTGPGFAFVVLGTAVGMAVLLWLPVAAVVWYRARRMPQRTIL